MYLDGLVYRLHSLEIIDLLIKSNKFLAVFFLNNRLKEFYNTKLKRSGKPKELFAQQILYNLIDSNSGFLGCIKSGTFYSSFHHLRFIIELYASVEYCFEKHETLENRLLRYIFYPDLEINKLDKNNSTINTLLRVFNTNEENLKNINFWHSEKNDQKLIDRLSDIDQNTHQNFCHYTHLSPLRFRSELPKIGFPPYWEDNCIQSLKYSILICISLIKNDCFEEKTSTEIKGIFNSVIKNIHSIEVLQLDEISEINKNYSSNIINDLLIKTLEKDSLFYHFETLIGKFYLLYEDKKLNFVTGGRGIFASDILCKTLDEAAGFLSCLKSGSFSSSLHHLRSLIELYAIFNYCSKNQEHFEKMMGRYVNYKEIEIQKRIQDQLSKKKNWGISLEIIDKHNKPVDEILRRQFSKSIKKIYDIKSWIGSATIADCFASFSSNNSHKANYDLLCYRTHPYSFRCQEYIKDELADQWPYFLTLTVKYSLDICSSIWQADLLEQPSSSDLESIWIDLAPIFLPRIKELYNKPSDVIPEN